MNTIASTGDRGISLAHLAIQRVSQGKRLRLRPVSCDCSLVGASCLERQDPARQTAAGHHLLKDRPRQARAIIDFVLPPAGRSSCLGYDRESTAGPEEPSTFGSVHFMLAGNSAIVSDSGHNSEHFLTPIFCGLPLLRQC